MKIDPVGGGGRGAMTPILTVYQVPGIPNTCLNPFRNALEANYLELEWPVP